MQKNQIPLKISIWGRKLLHNFDSLACKKQVTRRKFKTWKSYFAIVRYLVE